MTQRSTETYVVKVYLAGDVQTIKETCRKICYEVGLCVTVTETLFIYTGGEEYGVEIGLLNYPRFPATNKQVFEKAVLVGSMCRDACHQHSYLVVAPDQTMWNSKREE